MGKLDLISTGHSMDHRIREILVKISALEEELQAVLHTQEKKDLYWLEGKRVKFEAAITAAHRQLKLGLLHWLKQSRPQNVLSAPIIYGMIIPLGLLDLCLFIYQTLCFPLYKVPKVRRANFIVIDRHHLSYLNVMEKINCVYCGYANGLIAYAREIAARTEQYWCPIKHARRVLDSHRRYAQFLAFGDSENYHLRLERKRKSLIEESLSENSVSPE